MCAMSIFILLHKFDVWYMAILNLAVFSLALYPIISYLGRFPKVMEVWSREKRRDTLEHDTYIYRDVNIDCYILGMAW